MTVLLAADNMKIKFKLYATLQHKLPPTAVDNGVEIEVDEHITLHRLIDKFSVDHKDAHLVLVNGVYFDLDRRDIEGVLTDGDVVAVWPPVAGG